MRTVPILMIMWSIGMLILLPTLNAQIDEVVTESVAPTESFQAVETIKALVAWFPTICIIVIAASVVVLTFDLIRYFEETYTEETYTPPPTTEIWELPSEREETDESPSLQIESCRYCGKVLNAKSQESKQCDYCGAPIKAVNQD